MRQCSESYPESRADDTKMIDVKKLSGQSFREWNLSAPLGAGDSAIVYAATNGDAEAAIKIFYPDALDKHGFSEEQQRLELQLQLKDCTHPNLVRVFDGGVADELEGTLFLVMEKVPGATLDKLLGKIPRTAVPILMRQLADAAHYLEDHDFVHRDIKPANIIVNDDLSQLTLLDFGIIKNLVTDESGRLSGNRFVATPRYSPPEFVWRTEVESKDAWRAVTFYQIGGVLHDLIMRKRLFDGNDQPPARLYDAIRYLSPAFDGADCDEWLVRLAKYCLIKDWRERLRFVPSWESFIEPTSDEDELAEKQRAIRLRQVRREEMEMAKQATQQKSDGNKRIQALWELQDKVFLDTRRFLSGTQIFPRFSTNHASPSTTQHRMKFEFEEASELGFNCRVKAEISFQIKDGDDESTNLSIRALRNDTEVIFEGAWLEHLTIETASSIIQRCLVQIADLVVPAES